MLRPCASANRPKAAVRRNRARMTAADPKATSAIRGY